MYHFIKPNLESAIRHCKHIYINGKLYYTIHHNNSLEVQYAVNIIWERYGKYITSLRSYDKEKLPLYITVSCEVDYGH